MNAFEMIREYAFAQHALVVGIAVATICSLLSVVVVLKRMAFIGEGISHAGFGGVGTAMFLGLAGASQDVVILIFCLVTAIAIGVLSRRKHIEPDSAIGILLVAAMAWGVLMNDLRRNYQNAGWYVEMFGRHTQQPPSAESLLFGSLISVTSQDVLISLLAGAVILLLGAAFFKEIIFFMFDETVARVYGVSTSFFHYLLLSVLAVTVVLGVRLAGFVLVSALLVIPGATAVLLTRRLGFVFFYSWLVGLFGVVAGLLVSLQAGKLSSGPCIVGMLCLSFGAAFAYKSIRARLSAAR